MLTTMHLSAESESGNKPNILFIMSDDHTTQAIGAYGSRLAELDPTPNIDGKAVPRGINFRFGYNKTLEGTDLIVWVKTSGDKKTSFTIEAAEPTTAL